MFTYLWKTSRTPCSLAPMYLLRSSGPWGEVKITEDTGYSDICTVFLLMVVDKAQPTLMLMKFIPLSLATALANRVFPVPGAPYSSTPER